MPKKNKDVQAEKLELKHKKGNANCIYDSPRFYLPNFSNVSEDIYILDSSVCISNDCVMNKQKTEVFGLNFLEKMSKTKKIRNRYNPDKWNWEPANAANVKKLNGITKEEKKENWAAQTNYKPSSKKQRIVLTFCMGAHTHMVLSELRKRKIKYFYLSYEDFISKGDLKIVFDSNKEKKLLNVGKAQLNLDDVACVIWPGSPVSWDMFSTEFLKKTELKDQFWFRKRWSQLLRDLKGLLPFETKWIPSHPFNGSQEWQNKNSEYSIAIRIGFNVPPTIYTNSHKELLAFAKKYGNQLLFREFSCPGRSVSPRRVDLSKIKDFSTLKTSPCTFQKYIEKEYELRIVYLGGKVYPCKIHSQDSKSPEARFDWRVYDNSNVKWELSTIPHSLEKKIATLMKALDLEWGSLDFIKATDKKYYFLEVNRPGVQYWLDAFVGLNAGVILSDYLINQTKIDVY